jgi:phosphoglycolate phosphatase-like HAD superfamily hydrolase
LKALVLFDFDGTLARTLPGIVESYRHAFRDVLELDFPADDEDVKRVLTVRFTDLCDEMAGKRAPQLIASFRARYLGELEFPATLYEGVRPLLDELVEAEVPIGIVTNKTRVALDSDLLRTGFFEMPWASIVAADDSVERKPHPRPLLLGLERSGDGPHDVGAARAAGMRGVGAAWGDFGAASLRAEAPFAIAETPADLAAILLPSSSKIFSQTE